MGLQSVIQDAVLTGVNSFGDVLISITWKDMEDDQANYNPTTGTPSSTPENSYTVSNVVKSQVSDYRIKEGLAKVGDFVLGFPAKGLSFTPKVNDLVTVSSVDYRCKKVEVDPAGAFYECLCG